MSLENFQTPDSTLIIAAEEAKATPESLSETPLTVIPVVKSNADTALLIPSDQPAEIAQAAVSDKAFTETELFNKLYYELGVGGI